MIYKEAIQDAISMYDLPAEWSQELLKEAELIAEKTKKTNDKIISIFFIFIYLRIFQYLF